MDGFETTARIRATERGREVPILFLTALHAVAKGYDAGAADYITKPFDVAIVRARVKAFVDLFRQRENQRRERLETALNVDPALVSIVSVPGYICEFANVMYRRAFENREVLGASIRELGATAELMALLDRVAASGESLSVSERAMEVPSTDPPHRDRVANFTLQPLRDGRDRAEAIVIFAVDVTEQVRHRKELELAREQAERANRAKDDFLAIVSHELRTPLSSILGWTVPARRRNAPEDAGRVFEIIERNARTQARLVNDILDMSRIVGGQAAARHGTDRSRGGHRRRRRFASTRRQRQGHRALRSNEGPRADLRGRRSNPAGHLEPPLERHQVHEPRRAGRGGGVVPRIVGRRPGRRYRRGHRPRVDP